MKPTTFLKTTIAVLLFLCSALPAFAADDCALAKQVADKFLHLEQKGNRLFTNDEYDSIISYTGPDGEKADEPGWDNINVIDRAPVLSACQPAGSNEYVFEVSYHVVSTMDGQMHKESPHWKKETIHVLRLENVFKVNGVGIYAPYVTQKTIDTIAARAKKS